MRFGLGSPPSRTRAHQHQLRGTAKSDHENEHEALHPLTNALSKKIENHVAAIALHYMHYNFCRIHQTLRVTPAMEAGVTDHVWDIQEVVALLDSRVTASR